MRYLVAYDITSPSRLRRVARCLERVAVRIQYSVFVFSGRRQELLHVLAELERLIRGQDLVQVWPIPQQDDPELLLGNPKQIEPDGVILTSETAWLVHPIRSTKPKEATR